MQSQQPQSNTMYTLSNNTIQLSSNTNPSQINQYQIEKQNKIQFINKLNNQGYITLKVNFQFMENAKVKIVTKKIKAKQQETLLKIYVKMRQIFKVLLAEKGTPLRPQQGVFLFIQDQKIVQLRSTVKQMSKYMTQGPNGSYLEITGTTIEKFGSF